jgi:hypothetical protein
MIVENVDRGAGVYGEVRAKGLMVIKVNSEIERP